MAHELPQALDGFEPRVWNRARPQIKSLQRDLLICVTGFFRDPESFEALKRIVFPRIVRGRPENETIRIWVAGCATGEEAFSIAISLQEYLVETGMAFPIQIFASDISLPAIEKARTGQYLENIAETVSHERLDRFFSKIEGGYQINKNVRENCVFTRHNLIDDPPFSRLDLISCRNVLIYLGSVSEEPGVAVQLCAQAGWISDVGRIRRGGGQRTVLRGRSRPSNLCEARGVEKTARVPLRTRRCTRRQPQGDSAIRRLVGSRRGAETGRSHPVVEVQSCRRSRGRKSGSSRDPRQGEPYLRLPSGKVSFNLVKLIPDAGLFLQVEALILQARRSGEPVRNEGVTFELNGSAGGLNLEVVPLDLGSTRSTLVLFEPASETSGRASGPGPIPEGDLRVRHVAQLKQQLADIQEWFLSAVETHQTYEGPIDLLLTDVVTPELGGREFARCCPPDPAWHEGSIYVRAHPDTVLAEGIKEGATFLPKPFTSLELVQKVREALGDAAHRLIQATL